MSGATRRVHPSWLVVATLAACGEGSNSSGRRAAVAEAGSGSGPGTGAASGSETAAGVTTPPTATRATGAGDEIELQRLIAELRTLPLPPSATAMPALAAADLGKAPGLFGTLRRAAEDASMPALIALVPDAITWDFDTFLAKASNGGVASRLLGELEGRTSVTLRDVGFADVVVDVEPEQAEVRYYLQKRATAMLTAAWGPPRGVGTWIGPRWRADLTPSQWADVDTLTLRRYTPLAKVVGRGPDGLADSVAIVGADAAALLEAGFGERLSPLIRTTGADDPGYQVGVVLTIPPTDVCAMPSQATGTTSGDRRITTLKLELCVDDDDAARALALSTLKLAWGKLPTPGMVGDTQPFVVGKRRVVLRPGLPSGPLTFEIAAR